MKIRSVVHKDQDEANELYIIYTSNKHINTYITFEDERG